MTTTLSLQPRVVVFDLDGTLVDIIPSFAVNQFLEFSKEILSRYNINGADPEQSYRKALNRWKKVRDRLPGRRKYLRLWQLCFEGLGVGNSDAKRLADILQKKVETCQDRVYSDVVPLLSKLHRKGFVLGVLSERPDSAIKVSLARHKLSSYFDFCLSAYELDNAESKLNSKTWETLIRVSGRNPGEICYVGDDYATDFSPAFNHGIFAVLLDRKKRNGFLECKKIGSLKELTQMLRVKP